jgi:putative phosphoribosyl transferase
VFRDRAEAGQRLGRALGRFAPLHPVVLALPRGGVVVGAAVAEGLGAPLDVVIVRKLGAPHHEELAIGAVADVGGPRVILDETTVERLRVSPEYIRRESETQLAEIRRREERYRGPRPRLMVQGQVVILVDDGIATGSTVRAALGAVRAEQPGWLVLAAPVASPEALAGLRPLCDETVCLLAPEHFRAVGEFYEDFGQTQDDEVVELLARARLRVEPAEAGDTGSPASGAAPGGGAGGA